MQERLAKLKQRVSDVADAAVLVIKAKAAEIEKHQADSATLDEIEAKVESLAQAIGAHAAPQK